MRNDDQPWQDGPNNGPRYLTTIRPTALRPQNGALVVGGMTPNQFEPEASDFNFVQYWRLLLKHRLVIGGCMAAAVLLGLIATLLTTPVYRATTTIQIDKEAAQIVDVQGVEPEGTGDREYYQTQYELIASRSLAERIVERLNLADDEQFLAQRRQSPTTALRGLLRPNRSAAADRAARERRAISILMGGLVVQPVRGSRLVRISYDSPDPRMAARIANAISENYIGANLDRRFEASSYARRFLEERLATVKAKLEQSERELVQYAAAQRLVSVGSGDTESSGEAAAQSLTAIDLAAMNSALSQAKTDRINAEQRWRQAASTPGVAMPEVLANPNVQSLRQQRAKLATEYQEKLGVYKPDFPAMQQMQAQMAEIDRQIASEAQTVKQSLRAQYEIARNREASLQSQVSGLTSGVLDLRNRGIQYNILQREVQTNRTLYDGLLQRYKEIGVAGGLGNNNVSIVDRAQPPGRPYKPNLPINLAIAAAIGLVLGLVAALALESLDETIKVPEDIEAKLGIPLLGSIPSLPKDVTPAEALQDARSAFSEAYYSVRTALQFATDAGTPRSFLITSSMPSEGKSTTAIALATNFAKLGMRVLLVDADLRKPSLHRALHCDNTMGLSHYLTSSHPMENLIQATDQPNLAFMPCGPLPPNPAELLAGKRIRALVDEAEQQFDLLIFDGPPVLGLSDAPLLASVVAGTLLVFGAGSTRVGVARTALRRLASGNARILGALLSKFNARTSGYSYNYNYAYSYDYGLDRIEAR